MLFRNHAVIELYFPSLIICQQYVIIPTRLTEVLMRHAATENSDDCSGACKENKAFVRNGI